MAEITALRQQLVNLEEQLTDSTSVNVTDPSWGESDKNTRQDDSRHDPGKPQQDFSAPLGDAINRADETLHEILPLL